MPGDPRATADDLVALDRRLDDELDRSAGDGPATWVGHSAGGALVLLRGLDARLPPVDVVALAPVSDLAADVARRGGDGAVREWMGGGPDDRPELYATLDPAALLRTGRRPGGRWKVLHGSDDATVPAEQSTGTPLPPGTARILPGAHHFDVVDPDSPHVAQVYAALGIDPA